MLQEMAVEKLFLKMLHVIKIMVLFSPEFQHLLHQEWLFSVYNNIIYFILFCIWAYLYCNAVHYLGHSSFRRWAYFHVEEIIILYNQFPMVMSSIWEFFGTCWQVYLRHIEHHWNTMWGSGGIVGTHCHVIIFHIFLNVTAYMGSNTLGQQSDLCKFDAIHQEKREKLYP
jgi:hypothetical protein